MAWLEQRGKRFRVVFRFRNQKFHVNLKTTEPKGAEACRARLEENLQLVERGRLTVPAGADLGLFLLSDGKLDKPVELVRTLKLSEMFATYQKNFTAGAKEVITRKMEDVHMKHLCRIIRGETPVTAITSGTIQQFVDVRSREEHKGHPVKPKTVRKAVATWRFVWNWAQRQGHVPTKFPAVELVFPKEKQPEPFRTYDQIQAILSRGVTDRRRIRELWDGLFRTPLRSLRYSHTFSARQTHCGCIRFSSQRLTPVRGGANSSGLASKTLISTPSSFCSARRSVAKKARLSEQWT